MKRGGPLRRRRPLRATRTTTPLDVKEAVRVRSRGHCEIEHLGCPGFAAHFHHRQMRSQGGPHTAENLLHICIPMHNRIHADPGRAYRLGWLVRRSEDPAGVPWVLQDNQPHG